MRVDREEGRAGVGTGLTLVAPITLSTMAIVLLIPNLPALMREFADLPGRDYLVPMLLTVPALCVALFSPVAGALGDRFGRRRLLLAALLFYGLIGTAPIVLTDFWAILFSRVGVGITEALLVTLSTTMIADHFSGEARNRWLAGQTAAASLSSTAFFALGGLLGEGGWRTPFLAYLSAWAMMLAVVVFTWKVEPGAERADERLPWNAFPLGHTAGVAAVTIMGSVLFYSLQIQGAPGLAMHGVVEPSRIGFLTAIVSIGVPVGTLIYGRIGAAVRVSVLLMLEFAVLAVGLAVMSGAGGVAGFLLGLGAAQVGAGMLLPTLLVWAVSGVPFAIRARVTGVWTSAFSLGQFLSPLVFATAAAHLGGLSAGFALLAIAAAASVLAAAIARMRAPTRVAVG